MEPLSVLYLVSVAMIISFFAGVVLTKYAISEAQSIKTHVSEELTGAERRIRADLGELLDKAKSKL